MQITVSISWLSALEQHLLFRGRWGWPRCRATSSAQMEITEERWLTPSLRSTSPNTLNQTTLIPSLLRRNIVLLSFLLEQEGPFNDWFVSALTTIVLKSEEWYFVGSRWCIKSLFAYNETLSSRKKMKHRTANVLLPSGEALPTLFGNVVHHSVGLWQGSN